MLLASIGDCLKIWSSNEADIASLVSKNRYQSSADTSFHSLAWNHTNQVVAVGGTEPKVHLVQANNGQLLSSLVLSESKLSNVQVRAVAFSNNSRYLACAIGSPIQLWDLKRRQVKAVFTGHASQIVSIGFTSTGEVFAGDSSGKIKLWSIKSTSPVHELHDRSESKQQLSCMVLSPFSPLLAAGYADGGIKVWDAVGSAGFADTLLRTQRSHTNKVTGIASSPRNSRLLSTVGLDGKLILVDLGSKSPSDVCASCETGEVLTSLASHEDGIHSAVGTSEGNILIYDWRSLRHSVLTLPAHSPNPVNCLAFQAPRSRTIEGVSIISSITNATSLEEMESRTSLLSLAQPSQPPAPAPTATTTSAPAAATAPAPVHAPAPIPAPAHTAPPLLPDSRRSVPVPPSPVAVPPPGKTFSSSNSLLSARSLGPAEEPVPDPRKNMLSSSTPSRGATAGTPSMRSIPPAHVDSMISLFEPPRPPQQPVQQLPAAPSVPEGSLKPAPSSSSSKLTHAHSIASSDEAKAAAPNAIANASAKRMDESFASSYSHRVQTHLEVGGHAKPEPLAAMPAASSSDLQHQQSRLHAELDRSMRRSHVSTQERDSIASTGAGGLDELRQAVRPVSSKELEDALELLRYDIHNEMQDVIKEQVRQFVIAKEETAQLVQELSCQLKDLLLANKELRDENERLRRIY